MSASAGKFKVGDRVRLTADNDGFGVAGDTGTLLRWPDFVRFDREIAGDTDWYVNPSNLELVPVAEATGTLTIQAGRYYKTRDGRKVGPMVRNSSAVGQNFWRGDAELDGYSATWCKSGQFYDWTATEHKFDLVAEWVDEPAEDLSEAFDEIDELLKEFEEPSNDNKPEPDTNLLVAISADTSALDAEIDRVLKRLKKLRKKARKAGISLTLGSLQEAA